MKTHVKRFLSALISACMLVTLVPVTASAAVSLTNVPNQQIQYAVSLGDGQSEIDEDGVVDVTLTLRGTPYIDAEAPTDVVLMIDKSGSMQNDLDAMKKAAKGFVGALDLSVHRVGVVAYDNTAVSFAISDDESAIQQYIEDIPDNGGGTAIHNGVQESVKLLADKRSNAEGAIVLMTDGESDLGLALKAAEDAKSLGYSFFTVALCKDENSPANLNLKKMATSEADHYSVFSSSQLSSVYSNIASKIGDVNAKNVVITQEYNGLFELVPGSTANNIPQPISGSNSLRWEMTQLVRGEATLSYQLRPTSTTPEGVHPHALGAIYYTDYKGDRVKLDLPQLDIKLTYKGPSISSVSPSTVNYKGGETVVITGENFRPGVQVHVDGVSVPFTYVSDKELQFVMPAHDVAKRVQVKVKNPNGKLSYTNIAVAADRIITDITPNTAEVKRQQNVVITGSGFNGNYKTLKVLIGGVEASIATVENEKVKCRAPGLPEGVYDVQVINADKTTATLTGAYTSVSKTPIVDPCEITSVTPNKAEEETAQNITINGKMFKGTYKTTTVTIGSVSASVGTVSESVITCRVPKLAAGTYDVTVKNSDGTTATLKNGFTVNAKVVEPCEITSVSPNSIEEGTGTKVTISGKKFNGNYKTSEVYFGTVMAEIATVSETEVVCVVPELPEGTYSIKVVNGDDTSATLADAFTVNAKVEDPCKITGVSPNSGVENTSQKVTISGSKFNGNYKTAEVYFGTEMAEIVSVSDTEIVCKAPSTLAPGTYDVKVVNADGTTADLTGAYTVNKEIIPQCKITSLSVTTIKGTKRTNIYINGEKFKGNYKTLKVTIGGKEAEVATVSENQIKIRTYKMPAGVYDITVINSDKTTATLPNALTVT